MSFLLLLLGSLPSLAGVSASEMIYQATIQGGISVDASGVSTDFDGSSTWRSGDDLVVQIPSSATITEVYVVLHGKALGFLGDPSDNVRVNGVALDSATLTTDSDRYQVYALDPDTFGITGSGSYSYEEQGRVENTLLNGYGVSGAVLAVIYEDSALRGRRHVGFGVSDATYGEVEVTDTPTEGTTGEILLSYGVMFQCSDEQSGHGYLEGELFSEHIGGRDDGEDWSAICLLQDWNSLETMGSFGFDDTDTWVGTDGDDPDSEPADGDAYNSRLSDELWALDYDESGTLDLGYYDATGSSAMETFAFAIEMDSDQDGVRDADDDCTDAYDPDQTDADRDGEGDACDACTDVDGDGYGDDSYTASTCEADCDDADADVHPGAPEIDDGLDDDCDGHDETWDGDGDGITDLDEDALGTDPSRADTDGDGLSDGDEVLTYGTDPLDADTDGGSVSDGAEVSRGTDPLDPDDDVAHTGDDTGDPGDDTGAPSTDDTGSGGDDTGAPSADDTGSGGDDTNAPEGDDTGSGGDDTASTSADDTVGLGGDDTGAIGEDSGLGWKSYVTGGGCGCSTTPRARDGLGWLWLLGLVGLRRRSGRRSRG